MMSDAIGVDATMSQIYVHHEIMLRATALVRGCRTGSKFQPFQKR